VQPEAQGRGIGGDLLQHIAATATRRLLVGTWTTATWAVAFYERHGFVLTDTETKTRLLQTYWTIPDRQVEESVVLELTPAG
jgi:GNAT superfamily N-acetyltransferase